MTTSIFLVERHPGVVDLSVKNRAGVASYVFAAALTLDAAYAGGSAVQTLPRGATFRSHTLARNGKNRVEERNAGLTRFAYDPADYASATVPGDANICFMTVAEVDMGGNNLGPGPILAIPPAGFFAAGRRAVLPLVGTAPNVAGLASNLPSPAALAIDLPRATDEVKLYNDGAGSIFIAFRLGTPEIEVETGTFMAFPQTGATTLYLRGDGATAAFRLIVVLVNGSVR